MNHHVVLLRSSLLVLTGGLLFITHVSAQEKQMLRGRVLAAGKPVANQPVSLHRVNNTGGITLDADTTNAEGRFELQIDSLGAEGVFFVAARYEDQLYIGDTFRALPTAEYTVAVGPGATPIDLGAAQTAEAPPAPENPRAGLMVIVVAVIVLSMIFGLAARQRVPPARRFLVEIAELDNLNAATPSPKYSEQRADLIRRLRESA